MNQLRLVRTIQRHQSLVRIYILLIAFILVSAMLTSQFRTTQNIFNLLRQAVAFGLLGIGRILPILSGGIDLSVGSLVSLSTCLSAGLMGDSPEWTIPVIVIILLLDTGVGSLNTLMITHLRIPPFIFTLAMAVIVQGSVLLYTTRPIGSITRGFFGFWPGANSVPFHFPWFFRDGSSPYLFSS